MSYMTDDDILNDRAFVDTFLETASRTGDSDPVLSDAEKVKKRGLLLRAARKPVQRMAQVDVFTHAQADCVVHPDEDGDAIFYSLDDELRNSDCLRVQFPTDMRRADVVRALQKALETVNEESFWEYLDNERIGRLVMDALPGVSWHDLWGDHDIP